MKIRWAESRDFDSSLSAHAMTEKMLAMASRVSYLESVYQDKNTPSAIGARILGMTASPELIY